MSYDALTNRIGMLVASRGFQRSVVGVIVFSAILLGLETSQELVERHGALLRALDRLVLGVFVLEIGLKVLSYGRRPGRYFLDGWNIADLIIVGACLVPASPGALAVFRLIRILRVLRLVTALPKLQEIVAALLRSIPSMGYVVILLSIHFYMFAVLGTFLFRDNDPVHFGGLGKAFLSLFQILTLEGWADMMKTQIYGCQVFGYENMRELCVSSRTHPLVAPLYFVAFIVVGTMIILNLLIGVVVNGMAEAGQDKVSSAELLAEIRAVRAELAVLRKEGGGGLSRPT